MFVIMYNCQDFHVFLTNSASSTTSQFRVPLAFPLEFSSHAWSVALTDVAFTSQSLTLQDGDAIELYKVAKDNVEVYNGLFKKSERLTSSDWFTVVEEEGKIVLKLIQHEGFKNAQIKVNN